MTKLISVVVASLLLSVCAPAGATRVIYDLTHLGGMRYEYTYTLTNDLLDVPITEFTIYFQLGPFKSLELPSAPSGWDPLVAEPDEILGDGFYDALALTPVDSIAPRATLGGFSVEFDWMGTGMPGPQPFEIVEIVEPDKVLVLDSGLTSPAVSMPEPGSLLLLAIGLVGIRAMRSSIRKPVRSGN